MLWNTNLSNDPGSPFRSQIYAAQELPKTLSRYPQSLGGYRLLNTMPGKPSVKF
jgi:hypothetical protein